MANIRKKALGSLSWGKNVAKSFGLTSFDIIEDMNPIIFNIGSEVKGVAGDIKYAIDDLRTGGSGFKSSMDEDIMKSMGIIRGTIDLAKEDLKSGNFYNSKRKKKLSGFDMFDDDFGDDDLGFDDGFDFDDGDDDFGGDFDSNDSILDNTPVAKAITESMSVDVQIAEAQMKHDTVLNTNVVGATISSGKKNIEALGAINQNLGLLLQFNASTMTTHVAASMKYYESNNEHLVNILGKIDKIIEVRGPDVDKRNERIERRDQESEYVFGYDGTMSLSSYVNVVKNNIRGFADEMGFGLVEAMLGDSDSIGQMLHSPVSMVMKSFMKQAIPKILEETVTEFNNTIGAFMPAMMDKLNDFSNDYDNGLKQLVAQIFGTSVDYRTSPSMRGLKSEAKPFDTIAHKSLTDVIPTYLSKILHALSPKDSGELIYDYSAGKYTNIDNIKQSYDKRIGYSELSGYDSLSDINMALYDSGYSREEQKRLTHLLNQFGSALTSSNERVNPKLDDGDGSLANFISSNILGIGDEEQDELIKLIRSLPKHKQLALFSRERNASKRAVTDFNLGIENDFSSLYRHLYSGAYETKATIEQAPLSFDDLERMRKDRKKKQSIDDFLNEEDDKKEQGYDFKKERDAFKEKSNKYEESRDGIVGKFLDKTGLNKAVQSSVDFMNKGNDFMYDMVYGDGTGVSKDKGGFFTKILTSTRDKFDDFFGYLKEKIYEPIKEFFFGEDGLVNKFKESEFYGKAKIKFNQGKDYLFGALDSATGFRRGGLFSDTYNQMKDMTKGATSYFTGHDYINSKGDTVVGSGDDSVFAEVRGMFGNFKSTINSYLFGEKGIDKEDIKNGVLNVKDMLTEGMQSFMDAIFGTAEQRESVGKKGLFAKESLDAMKERAPKAFATGIIGAGAGLALGGKMGLLGLFLPGGPIGGAILGTTLGFLNQSETFKEWMFGPMDEESKERAGGFVSKDAQEFFKKHRVGMIGGGAMGLVKSAFGGAILPTFLLGGPLTGVATGIATSFIFRSDAFKNAMFGEEIDGERAGGLVGTILGKFGQDGNAVGKMAVGALGGSGLALLAQQFGILGALSVGPMGAAVLGASSGIALMSEKWKKSLFGEMKVDENTNELYRDGGLLGKITNWTSLEVLQPFKLKMMEGANEFGYFLETKIAEPLQMFIDPLKTEIAHLGDTVKDGITMAIDRVMNSKPARFIKFGVDKVLDGFNKFVFKPFKTALDKLVSFTGKIAKFAISMPFSALGALGDRMTNKQINRGLIRQREEWWNDENLGLFKTIGKSVSSRFRGTEAYKEAAYGQYGADYFESRQSAADERKANRDEKYNARKNQLREMNSKLDYNQTMAQAMGYNIRDKRGVLNREIYEDVEKATRKRYGKDWDGASLMQKETFALEKKADTTRDEIKSNTKTTADTVKDILNELKHPSPRVVEPLAGPELTQNHTSIADLGLNEDVKYTKDGNIIKGVKFGEDSSVETKSTSDKAKEKKLAAKTKAANAHQQSLVAKGSASAQAATKAAEEAKEQTETFMSDVVSNQGAQLVATKAHSKSWLGIFGPKGLITVGLLGVFALLTKFGSAGWLMDTIANGVKTGISNLPGLIKDAMRAFLNEQSPDRQDSDGSVIENQTGRETMTRQLVRGGATLLSKSSKILKTGIQTSKKLFTSGKNVVKGVKSVGSELLNKVYKKAGIVTDDVAKAAVKGAAAVDPVATANSKAITKFKSAADDLLKFIIKLIEKAPGGKKLTTAVMPKLTALFTQCFGPKVQKNMANAIRKAATGLDKGLAKSVPVLNVLFVGYGITTGFNDDESARLFGVDVSDVDSNMKITTSIVNGLRNAPVVWILDIANVVLVETTGVDFIRSLAGLVYVALSSMNPFDGMSGDYANKKLNAAQNKSKDDWEAYNAAEKEKNPEFQGISYQAWLDKNTESTFTKLSTGVKNLPTTIRNSKDKIKDGLKGQSRNSGERWESGVAINNNAIYSRNKNNYSTDKNGIIKFNTGMLESANIAAKQQTMLLENTNKGILSWVKTPIISDDSKTTIKDPKTKKDVTPDDVGTYAENSLTELTKSTNIFTRMNNALKNQDTRTIKDENGNFVRDPSTGAPVKIKNIGSYITNTMVSAASKIASLGSALGATIEFSINGNKTSTYTPKPYTGSFGGGSYDEKSDDEVDKGLKPKSGKYGVYVDQYGNEFGIGGLNESALAKAFQITSPYGPRNGAMHHGVDLKLYNNAPIPAFTDGEVISTVSSYAPDSGKYSGSTGSYGNMVKVKDGQGNYQVYGHLNAVNVQKGMKIKRGDVIGKQGHTGNSTGSHLHYEVRGPKDRYGLSRNPLSYLDKYTGDPNATSDVLTSSTDNGGTESTVANTGLMGLIDGLQSIFTDNFSSPLSEMTSGFSSILSGLLGDTSGTLGINAEFPETATSNLQTATAAGAGITKNLTKFNTITVNELNNWIASKAPKGSTFIGQGKAFLQASAATGLDPRYLVAHAALETGWGSSPLAKEKHNYFGIGAHDRAPYEMALTFESGLERGVMGGAKWIKANYTNRGQDTLATMHRDPTGGTHSYASDPDWATKIASIMASAPQGVTPSYSLTEGIGGGSYDEDNTIGNQLLNIFSKNKTTPSSGTTTQKFMTTKDKSIDKSTLMEKIIELLAEIALNTGTSNVKATELKDQLLAMLEELSNKSSSAGNVAVVNSGGSSYNSFLEKQKFDKTNRDYQIAKQVSQAL